MAEDETSEPLSVYELRPPEWLPKVHVSADLGYIGFSPPRPHQVEETLTEANVKNGLQLPHTVPAETYSAQDSNRKRLMQENALHELEDLMNQIFARKAESVPGIPASSFRLPSRVTLNDAKRQAWFADLANPDVPLAKLGKNVPHGAKGHDLLDLLHTNNVAIPRAVWFLRVFGANESAGLRNRPTYNPTQYSVEWANVMTTYLKKQLADIALPSAPRPGLSIKQTFKGVLSDVSTREKWISRFTYCLSLLRTFYAEGLVDNRTFLSWLVQQMATCNLAQLGFVARLADEYLDGMLVSRALTHPVVEACLAKYVEIQGSAAKEQLTNTANILRNLISRSFLSLPDASVSPRMYIQYGSVLEDILLENFAADVSDSAAQPSLQSLHQTVVNTLLDVQRRNEAMLFHHLPPRVLGTLSSALSDIKLLNSISGKTDLTSVALFEDTFDISETFTRKLDFLLTWSVTPLQYGDHRPYAAACLLQLWRNRAEERAIRRDAPSSDDQIQSLLFHWLNKSEVAGEPSNLPAVALLFGQLVKHGLFSFGMYMQHLVARGEEGLSYTEPEGGEVSRHREFLRWIPLHEPSPSLMNERKGLLYGLRVRETPEEANEREIRKELRSLLPELFGGEPQSGQASTTTFWLSCSSLLSAPRFEQVKTIKQWFLPIYKKWLLNQSELNFDSEALVLRVYTLTTVIMARIRSYGSILDMSLATLEHATSSPLLNAVIETLRQHMEVWACMNRMQGVASALWAVHQTWRSRGSQNRMLLKLLAEVDNDTYLEPAAREQMLSDISAYTHALFPTNENPSIVPPVLPEILMLATDPAPGAPSLLANSLWYKYMTSPDWAWKVWDNTVASLRQLPAMLSDVASRRECALRYATFLLHVDQHLPRGFDEQIRSWLLGSGRNEIAALTTETWDVVTVVLLYLNCYGALATTTILESLVFQVWQAGANVASEEQGQALETLLTSVNNLFEHLLLRDECGTGLPPADVFEAQGLMTRRRDVFREPHFSLLVSHFPALVLIEQNRFLSETLRAASSTLRKTICRVNVFRQGIYRDLDAVRITFEKLLESQSIPDDLHEPLVSALRLMLNDPGQDGPVNAADLHSVSSLLSHWKLAATSIEIRLTIKQLQEGMSRESTRVAACASLDRLTSAVFYSCKQPEEADFIADLIIDVDRTVAGKFVNAGLKRVTDIFREWDPLLDNRTHNDLKKCASEILRLMANIVAPFRQDASLPQLDPPVQDIFFSVLCAKIKKMTESMATLLRNPWEESAARGTQAVVFLARMLQFHLGFAISWSQQAKENAEELCRNLTQLALMYGTGDSLNMLAFPLILDTLCYTLDEIPGDIKATVPFDPFRNYPEFNLSELPADLPPEYKTRMRSLLPYVELNPAVEGLIYTTRDASGALISSVPVQNRPWEWTEYIGENPAGDLSRGGDERALDGRTQVKNSAALSLELFEARVTGDRIILPTRQVHQGFAGDVEDMMAEENLRSFQDDVYSEGPFRRDWRETRIPLSDGTRSGTGSRGNSAGDDNSGTGVPPLPALIGHASRNTTTERRPSSRGPSPASSVRSAGSARSVASLRQSPAHALSRLSVSTSGDIIDADALDGGGSGTGSSNKRKTMSTIAEEDSDIEIIEGPIPKSQNRAQKRAKGRAAEKSTSKTTKSKR
ncbi:hypothetical protein DICSQDRAFT_182976 [Dichomitus squalens LYAD-421 SS1]|uniref:Mediator of RNA polymerase II transcription subunit 12 n=1 Tax=Dichomitus squalens (strain LYAD-421) TaxID=732165 RepID=R7SRZ4_DICSQ|nr:uncharacterized protein DICSQDRAFT_182976 [Dichomitus squalens LYAD-421 SS1]EJF57727.1 hypothetical protein DICSQDRAFT_182976 [Dichomitus squalens LYAD-421 SS1]